MFGTDLLGAHEDQLVAVCPPGLLDVDRLGVVVGGTRHDPAQHSDLPRLQDSGKVKVQLGSFHHFPERLNERKISICTEETFGNTRRHFWH